MTHETNYDALRSAFQTIIAHIQSIDVKLGLLEERVSNTLDNTKPILENFQERISKLEIDKEKIFEDVLDSHAFERRVKELFDDKIECFDPSDLYRFEDGVRNVVENLDLIDEIDLKDKVREILSDARIEI